MNDFGSSEQRSLFGGVTSTTTNLNTNANTNTTGLIDLSIPFAIDPQLVGSPSSAISRKSNTRKITTIEEDEEDEDEDVTMGKHSNSNTTTMTLDMLPSPLTSESIQADDDPEHDHDQDFDGMSLFGGSVLSSASGVGNTLKQVDNNTAANSSGVNGGNGNGNGNEKGGKPSKPRPSRKGTLISGGIVKKTSSVVSQSSSSSTTTTTKRPTLSSVVVKSSPAESESQYGGDDYNYNDKDGMNGLNGLNEKDDEWRPSPEEYAKMSSKEKRQLRNKISARNFRVRRKG